MKTENKHEVSNFVENEQAATRIYTLALEKYADDPRLSAVTTCLEKLRDTHEENLAKLRNAGLELELNGSRDPHWQELEHKMIDAANLKGENSGIATLRESELHVLGCLETALTDGALSGHLRKLSINTLLPGIEDNLRSLDHLFEITE